jgi:hypothetical protein
MSGRLVFQGPSGRSVAGVTIHAEPALADLYRAHFEHPIPSVHVQDGIVTVQYHRHPLPGWSAGRRAPLAHLTLNGALDWEVEFRDGVSRLTADLRKLPLRSLDLSAVSGAMLMFPRPAGTAFVYISGSASDITIQRPLGVALRIHISGSTSELMLGEQRFGAVADGIRWQTPGYNSAADRYDISVSGSVSNLTIAT